MPSAGIESGIRTLEYSVREGRKQHVCSENDTGQLRTRIEAFLELLA